MAVVKNIEIGLRSSTEEFEAGMKRGVGALATLEATTKRVMASMDKNFKLVQNGAITIDEYNRRIQASEEDLKALASGFNGMGEATKRAQSILTGMETETDRYNQKLRELNKLKDLGVLKEHEHAAAVAHTTTEYKRSIPVAEAVGSKTSFLTKSLTPFATGLLTAASALKGLQVASNLAHRGLEGVHRQFETIDEAKKSAATIGIATGELMKLRFAVKEVAGVEVDDLLKKMIRNIAEAATTGKGATDTINRLGLSVSKLTAMSPEKAFFTLVEAISAVEGSGERAAAAVDIFGKTGVDLGPIFEQSAAALKSSADFAERVGMNLSEVDASAIEQANDGLGRMSALLDSIYRQIAVELAPQVIALSKTFLNMATDEQSSLGKMLKVFGFIGDAVAMLIDSIDNLAAALAKLAVPQVGDLAQTAVAIDDIQDSLSSATGGKKTFLDEYRKNLEEVRKDLDKTGKEAQKKFTVGGAFDALTDISKKSAAHDAKAELSKINKAKAEADHRAKLVLDMEREVSGNSPDMKFKHTVEDINDLLQKQLITLDKRNQLVAMAHKTIIEEPAAKKALSEKTKQIETAAKIRVDTSPFEKFAAEAAKFRKLELSGELTQQQAAQATLKARQEAIAELLKLQKAQIQIPRFSIEAPRMAELPAMRMPELPMIQTPVIKPPQFEPTSQALVKMPKLEMPKSPQMQVPEIDVAFNTKAIDAVMTRGNKALEEMSGQFTKQGIPVADSLRDSFMLFERTVERLKFLEAAKAITPEQSTQAQALARGDTVRQMQDALTTRQSFKPMPNNAFTLQGAQDRASALVQRVQDNIRDAEAQKRAEFAKPFYAQMSEPQRQFQALNERMMAFQQRAQLAVKPTSAATAEMDIRNDAMKARSAELTKQFENPLKTFQRKMVELSRLRMTPGGIDSATFQAAAMDARATFMQDMQKRPDLFQIEQKGPAALEAGSQAAFSAFHESARNMRNKDNLEKITQGMAKDIARMAREGTVLKKANF